MTTVGWSFDLKIEKKKDQKNKIGFFRNAHWDYP
jgi:hypothetical protein